MNTQYLKREGQPTLAYIFSPAPDPAKHQPLVMFLGGYRSDMTGTKAVYLEEQCRARGQGYLRFDYSGHGQSEGKFEDGTIGDWFNDALDILDHIVKAGPVVLVGSSMGGWIALLVALERPGVVQGLVGIAAAPDFTEDLYALLDEKGRAELERTGRAIIPNDYSDEPYTFTKKFYEDAKKYMVLTKKHRVDFPMRLVQGMLDKDVPWQTAMKIQKNFEGADIDIAFVEDGGHRLSRPEDLELIDRELKGLCGLI